MLADLLSQLVDASTEWSRLLGSRFVGAYVTGSVCLDAFEPGTSDVDVLIVVDSDLPPSVASALAESALSIGHTVSASGLECVALTRSAASTPIPHFQVCTSSGSAWKDEAEFDDDDLGLFVDISVCRRNGITLAGPPVDVAFASANDDDLAMAIAHGLSWHRGWILDEFHDPGGQNSVLNACRAWHWLETRDLTSKDRGGRWALQRGGPTSLIHSALNRRQHVVCDPLGRDEIDEFLLSVLSRFKAAGFLL